MRNSVIWCVMLLTMAGTAFSETKEPPKELAVDLGKGVKMEMVLIPAGEFKMGDDKSGYDWEKPVHKVNITKPFYLGKYEVTQEQWAAVMRNNPSRFTGDPDRPVENVSWDMVQDFLGQLNAKEKDQGAQYRLPTEAEWEYAARAGTTTAYSFGDDLRQLGKHAWYGASWDRGTHPVGQLQPNPWGLYDMHGNVWEWVQDWYASDYYKQSPSKDPPGPDAGNSRVVRGGSFVDSPGNLRSARRFGGPPTGGRRDIGFRCVRVSPQP